MCDVATGAPGRLAARLYCTKLSDDEEFYRLWYGRMSKSRRERCDRYSKDADRHRCIMAYALLEHALNDAGQKMSDIGTDENGKPCFMRSDLFFNISHSDERVTVALSSAGVGCDVENKSKSALKIAGRFFTDREYELLASLDKEGMEHMFTRLWTLKESVVKCSGEGIRRSFKDFSLVDDAGMIKRSVTIPGTDDTFYVREYDRGDGYCYSICSLSPDIEDDMRCVSWQEI